MAYKIVRFDKSMLSLLPRPQEPFEIIGRLISVYDGKEWTRTEELLDTPREKLYPDDSFNPNTF